MDLFGQNLLDADTHKAVFGELPSSLQAHLRTAEAADLVVQLLDAGWRRGQLAARLGAMPAGNEPLEDVLRLLRGFLDQLPPDARWREEKAQRESVRASQAEVEGPASEESKQRWVSQIRAELAVPRPIRTAEPVRLHRQCTLCGEEGTFFVTREVRLCETCVGLLQAGAVRLPDHDQLVG